MPSNHQIGFDLLWHKTYCDISDRKSSEFDEKGKMNEHQGRAEIARLVMFLKKMTLNTFTKECTSWPHMYIESCQFALKAFFDEIHASICKFLEVSL